MGRAELRGVVALDGPSGTGKSTVARRLAAALHAAYLDTGAMYRAITLAVLQSGVAIDDAVAVGRVARQTSPRMTTDPENPGVSLNDVDVSAEIRDAEVTAAVSAVSAVPEVREAAVIEQQRIIAAAATAGGIVVEGRDIGSVVAPDAGLKVYLTADATARAQRRNTQDSAAGRASTVAAARADVERRDAIDSGRQVSPLRRANDAVELDTTDLEVSAVLRELHGLVQRCGMAVACEGSRS